MRFISNYLQGYIAQRLGYDMRTKMYQHICDLPFSYHNNADLGDLIQRSTSDIDQTSNFVAVQIPNFLSIFRTIMTLQTKNISLNLRSFCGL